MGREQVEHVAAERVSMRAGGAETSGTGCCAAIEFRTV